MTSHAFPLPESLPVPIDDGACLHLSNLKLASVPLRSTSGTEIDLSTLTGLTIVFIYPRTGAPGEQIPVEWDLIPGARGCTPQACSFRDSSAELNELGVNYIFGLSTQDTAYQAEVKERLHLPYDILSDEDLKFVHAHRLPVFEWQGKLLTKRLVLVIQDGLIIKKFYPVFPPSESANQVIAWLKEGQS